MRAFIIGFITSIAFGALMMFVVSDSPKVEAQGTVNRNSPWVLQAELLVADTTKLLAPAVGTNRRRVVTYISCTVLTAAAQTVTIEDTSAGSRMLRIPASATGQWRVGPLAEGMILPAQTSLRIQPAAAGPAVHCLAEGYWRGFDQ